MFLHNTKAHFSFIDHSANWGLVQSAVPHNAQLHTPDSSQETKTQTCSASDHRDVFELADFRLRLLVWTDGELTCWKDEEEKEGGKLPV